MQTPVKSKTEMKKYIYELRPFLSLFLILFTLFLFLFFKMEERRLGYLVFKKARQYRILQDRHRLRVIEYSKLTNTTRLELQVSRHLDMATPKKGQFIYMGEQQLVMEQ